MKNLFIGVSAITIGLIVALSVSALFIGFDDALNSLKFSLNRSAFVFRNPEKIYLKSYLKSNTSVLGVNSDNYNKLEIKDIAEVKSAIIPAPFTVPSSGIAGHKDFLYLPATHPGIDIWTTKNGKGGQDGDVNKGNPVYSACSGTVTRIFYPNQEIEIICDQISNEYEGRVPSLKVKILYSHMGNAVTHEVFHSLKLGQRVNQGQFVGYQGAISSFVPVNRVVHLHFGVYDLTKAGRPSLDPSPYIGLPTNVVGQLYEANP